MQRQKATFPLAYGQYKDVKKRLLSWGSRFSNLIFLDSNEHSSPYSQYECLLGADVYDAVTVSSPDSLSLQQQHLNSTRDWYFGHFAYDFKNHLELSLVSSHKKNICFPDFYFFIPRIVCYIDSNKTSLTIESLSVNPNEIFQDICNIVLKNHVPLPSLTFKKRTDRGTYLHTIKALKKHIANGDCYEINYCTEGFCENADIEPVSVFNALNQLSPAPFAAYYRLDDKYMMCASPERYLQKAGNTILAQPIKGTARRDADPDKDVHIKTSLQQNIKERAENVMIVDLMRNDLARSCEVGSIQVDELFGVYTFPQVHQLISTISGQLKKDYSLTNALRYSFPIGSMTGAPKIKVMQLIDKYEQARRELYSGAVGYITPMGNFDFNVVIRSLFYNAANKYLSYQTGGAITYDSNPELEWEEMRLKAWALEKIFA